MLARIQPEVPEKPEARKNVPFTALPFYESVNVTESENDGPADCPAVGAAYRRIATSSGTTARHERNAQGECRHALFHRIPLCWPL